MAVSKTISANGSHGHHKFTLTVKETKTDVTKNTSTVSIVFKISPIETGWKWEEYYNHPPKGTVNVNGKSYSWSRSEYDGKTTITLINETQTITHSADGSKSISIGFSCESLSDNYLPGSASASGTLTLTKIARASSFSVSSGTIGVQQKITVTKQNADYTHTITAKAGSYSQTKWCDKKKDTTVYWTPDPVLAQASPKSTSVSVTLILQTYSGNTAIGDPVTKTVSVTIPTKDATGVTGIRCKISSVTFTDVATLPGSTETLEHYFGGYIQNKSKIKAVVATDQSVATARGATSTSARIVANGITYSSNSPSSGTFTITGTNQIINYGEAVNVVTTLTDSRGATDVKSSNIKIYQYSQPAPTVSVGRCAKKTDGTYVDDDGGNYGSVRLNVKFTDLVSQKASHANTAKAKVTYRLSTEQQSQEKPLKPDGATLDSDNYFDVANNTGVNMFFVADESSTYVITTYVKDTVGSSITSTAPLSTAESIMDFPVTGEAMGIGKVVDQGRQSGGNLDIGWNTYIQDTDHTITDAEMRQTGGLYPKLGIATTTKKRLYTVLNRLATPATTSAAGLMSANDKKKLDGIVNATTSAAGLMSAADKTKLNALGTLFPDQGTYGSFSDKTVTSTTTTQYWNKFTLPSDGIWLIHVFVDFPANATGYRYVAMLDSASDGASANTVWQTDSRGAFGSARVRLHLMFIYKSSSSADRVIPIGVAQTSGKDLTARCRYRAVKLSN